MNLWMGVKKGLTDVPWNGQVKVCWDVLFRDY